MAFHRLVEFFSVCCCHLWWHKIKKAKETKNILGKTKMNEMKKCYDSKQVISIGTLLNRARAPSQRTIHTVGEKDWTEKKTQIVSDYRHYFVRYYSCNNLLMWCIFFFFVFTCLLISFDLLNKCRYQWWKLGPLSNILVRLRSKISDFKSFEICYTHDARSMKSVEGGSLC